MNEKLEQMYQDCDLQRGKLLAEVARLRKALEQIAGLQEIDDIKPTLATARHIAAAALEGKDD